MKSLFVFILMGQCSFITCQLYDYHFIKDNKTWDEAQTYCREKYTDLATVSNMTDMKRLIDSTQSQAEAWIGLHSYPGRDNRTWYWSLPGVDFNENQTRWEKGQPNDWGGPWEENCVLLINNKWSDYLCTHLSKFICDNETNQANKTCHVIDYFMTWPQAQNYCRENHTDLISGLDQLYDCAQSVSVVWIGLFRDTWRWSDGSNSSFRYWESLSNNDMVDGESDKTCATTVLNRAGRWSFDYCSNKKPFICYDAPVKQHLVEMTLRVDDPTVDMKDPAVAEALLKQLEQKFREKGVSVKLSWRKLPEKQNTCPEIDKV
ncbi:hypothetical protein Q5P01_002523 [Channa striata]|uniref:C-type lectin domain-containing protein n=1 Tax=Channa striata TaxID=64152 RepID=A0AA88NPC6_CHASR|nr:hypothetical protein Q5P01_002523 [Channa striata]